MADDTGTQAAANAQSGTRRTMRLKRNPNEPGPAWAVALALGVVVVWASSGFLIHHFVGADREVTKWRCCSIPVSANAARKSSNR